MPSPNLILAIDQGTTSSRSIVFDDSGQPISKSQTEIELHVPHPGWVEQDPIEIAETSISTAREALESAKATAEDIAAIGIANQRETTICWDAATGRPLANAIVWQDRRTAQFCNELSAQGAPDEIWTRTGLQLDPYFSATKMRWLLDNIDQPNLISRAESGGIRLGTVDSWIVDRLVRGNAETNRTDIPHITDVTNASRTMLFNIHEAEWDSRLLEIFDIPEAVLAEPLPSTGPFATAQKSIFGAEIPIMAIAGDQHAALYGQTCFTRGDVKCTYGTGAFILANSGTNSGAQFATRDGSGMSDSSGLLFTTAWQIGGARAYAYEGSIFTTGATIQWLRDQLGIITDASESSDMAVMAGDNDGVYMVPAFVGLGTPHWDPSTRASITGMTRGTNRDHIVRAALESTAYQVKDVIDLMDSNLRMPARGNRRERVLKADGGQSRNPFLMQFQADLLDRPIEVSTVDETTALGVAYMAGRSTGMWRSERELSQLWQCTRRYEPLMTEGRRGTLLAGWNEALRRTKTNYSF